jgi:hypothetical protein
MGRSCPRAPCLQTRVLPKRIFWAAAEDNWVGIGSFWLFKEQQEPFFLSLFCDSAFSPGSPGEKTVPNSGTWAGTFPRHTYSSPRIPLQRECTKPWNEDGHLHSSLSPPPPLVFGTPGRRPLPRGTDFPRMPRVSRCAPRVTTYVVIPRVKSPVDPVTHIPWNPVIHITHSNLVSHILCGPIRHLDIRPLLLIKLEYISANIVHKVSPVFLLSTHPLAVQNLVTEPAFVISRRAQKDYNVIFVLRKSTCNVDRIIKPKKIIKRLLFIIVSSPLSTSSPLSHIKEPRRSRPESSGHRG